MRGRAQPSTVAAMVFLASLCLYLLTAGGHLYTADDWAKYKVAEALVRRGNVQIPRAPHVYGVPGRGGTWVSIFPPGTSLVSIPLYLAGSAVPVHDDHARDIVLRGSVSLLNQFVVAATCAILFLVVHQISEGRYNALLASGAFAVGTMAWPYAKHFWSEPAAALMLLSATLVLWRRSVTGPRDAAVAGAFCGAAFLFKYEVVLFFPAVVYWIVRHGRRRSYRLPLLGAWACGVFVLAAPVLWYNWARFGVPWQIGYGSSIGAEASSSAQTGLPPLTSGVKALFLSLVGPGRGLLWYNLAIVAAVMGWRKLAKARPTHSWFLLLAVIPLPLFVSFTGRSATWAWGPRLLFPLIPFLLVPAAFARRWLKPATVCAVVINIGAVGVNFHDAIETIRREGGFKGWEWTQAVETQPRYFPIIRHLRLLGPSTRRTVWNIAGRTPRDDVHQGLEGYSVAMRKDSLDLIWFVLTAAGVPVALVVSAVAVLGMISLRAWQLAERWCA